MDFSPIALTLAICFLLFFYLRKLFFSAKKQSKNVPEATGAWPIIGHLHLLNEPQMPHKIYGQMAEKYGPIFRLKLGVNEVVIVSDHKIVKECFTTNDRAFATRPKSIGSEILGYNYAMFGLGPYWREIRKIVTIEFFSARRIEMLQHIKQFEVKSAVTEIYNNSISNLNGVVKMEMKEWFGNLIMNTMVKMLFGVQYKDGWILEAMKETAKEIDFIVEDWLAEHRRKRKLRGNKCKDEDDFMDVMLSMCEDKDIHGFDADTTIKTTCMIMLSAGTDTTIVTLIWTLSLLLNNYEALKKAQDELDTHIGKNRWVQESDIKNLVYLQAIVKESLRLYSPGPLLLPHESIEDCVVSGYDIPKGTRLLVNVWKLHNDPKIWPNPHEFKPERFLTTHKDVDGFDIKRPSDEAIDMSESFGLTILKASPLEVHLTPRLNSNLYYE
ncbi:hypothetical protein MTR67_020912 [Solanum verrucosum]|uniref:Cytochrome P450 n=1 Tax=Solanum verrucosum TaxID=315347 RepID=A0AAF0QRK7_SOLVR|nr:hypothetical protein MTR67_020912 [Solanum verrucosum]